MRRGTDVDVRYGRLPGGWNNSFNANAFSPKGGHFGMNHASQALMMAISYWGYVTMLPAMIVASVILGLVRRKD